MTAAWPPPPIHTERLVLREPEPQDRTAIIDLLASPDVGTYIGGPQPRDELERTMPDPPRRRPGLFVVALDGAMIGTVTLDPRDPERPDQIRLDLARYELGYLFLPHSWGRGYATEACAAALTWFATANPGEPIALSTQTANTQSLRLAEKLGFTEAARYEAFNANQWLGIRPGS
ncbi:GNAT family N-acetyltransferase [Kribbella solani]|uniref:RimJ/RimL family protein N-acetyltransferase n=1 Tax=Kribbella solani TaxID=236067 RepID=A0A841E235_9ACTN|nr:GNAT family N-acetyltransferase [Kribbella solani]MBB5982467.1 RimJ/RimL family protein N-acetyltransferase [Kribbella solani]